MNGRTACETDPTFLTSNCCHPSLSGNTLLNDARLIRNRQINCNLKTRRGLELICEDKISKYKLEEVHCSLPSSVKSTFIMTFSPDGRKVASTHGDHRIYICDLNTGKLLYTLDGHSKTPWCLAWHPSNKEILASGCLAGEVRVWDLRSKACETWNSENNTIITSLDFHPKERILVIASSNDIFFWDWSESRPFAKTTTTHDKEKVKFVEFDPTGTKLVTGISNLPKYAGYSSDSLQNRIIDSYLQPGLLEQIPTENMTQNSETTNPLSGSLNSNDTFNDQILLNRRTAATGTNNNEHNVNCRSTVTLSRVASLYRQLEALEDSMRHTSFSPYMEPRPMGSATVDPSSSNRPTNEATSSSTSRGQDQTSTDNLPGNGRPSSQGRAERTPTAFEPFVVTFDESLEHLQLLPLVLDGQTINMATLIERYPIDLTYQMHYEMQFESLNQVNQNFIRISKLMSSVRLYRQVVHQILSNSSGQGHYQPNQVLTAQSASPRSSRLGSTLPIVFRNFPVANPVDANSGTIRSTDPIMAIQFRNSARNVPLVTICKIELLSARSVCIMRSQLLIEQALAGFRSLTTSDGSASTGESNESGFYPLLNQLHQTLTNINHAPLTTSNVHAHISSLRNLVNKLLTTLSTLMSAQEEGQRLIRLIHDIAHSLVGRTWTMPLGATLDDIRLDVIHTLCVVDLTLHLTRQIQLLQMQRLSTMARIEESRRANTSSDNANALLHSPNSAADQLETIQGPSTSHGSATATTVLPSSKRKDSETTPTDDDSKRRKVENVLVTPERSSSDTEMIEAAQNSGFIENSSSSSAGGGANNVTPPSQMANNFSGSLSEALASDRLPLVMWNSTQNQAIEQSIHRFLVASTASSVSNSHILVRIYHRLHGTLPVLVPSAVLEQSNNNTERQNPPYESRRRALSQDNSSAVGSFQEGSSPTRVEHARSARQFNVNFTSSSGTANSSNAAPYDNLPRHPHFHVYQGRSAGPHLWFNQWTIPLPINNLNYRLQCWDFSTSALPNIKDSQSNIVTQKCRIHNDASIDISSDGSLIGCLVPRDDVACLPSFDLKIFSLRTSDFGVCYYQLPHGPNAISVSMSPTASHAVVGLSSNKFISNDPNDDDLTIAKVFKLKDKNSSGYVRDIKIKRDDSSLSLNAIRWMERGIVYNVGPQHHQRYHARMRNRVV